MRDARRDLRAQSSDALVVARLLGQIGKQVPEAIAGQRGELTVVGQPQPDKGYAGREFERQAAELDVLIVRPRRKDEPGKGPHLAPIRQCVESIFQTMKTMLGLEDHGARELHTLRARLATKFLALTAAIVLNHRLGRPPRNLTAYYT